MNGQPVNGQPVNGQPVNGQPVNGQLVHRQCCGPLADQTLIMMVDGNSQCQSSDLGESSQMHLNAMVVDDVSLPRGELGICGNPHTLPGNRRNDRSFLLVFRNGNLDDTSVGRRGSALPVCLLFHSDDSIYDIWITSLYTGGGLGVEVYTPHLKAQSGDVGPHIQEGDCVNFRHHNAEEARSIVQLFNSVFTQSEGEAEGALIGKLVTDLFDTTDHHDLFNFVAVDADAVVASIFFTRLKFDDHQEVFMLAPVAVCRERQREGIGQALIRHGLKDLDGRGVEFVITYGDPAFYGKVGFQPVSPSTIRPPFNLTQPEGWLGQSLSEKSMTTLSGNCKCVDAFNTPVYW